VAGLTAPLPDPYPVRRAAGVSGVVEPPGSKSISHRALNLALIGQQPATIENLLEADDIAAFRAALVAMGWRVRSVAGSGLRLEPGPEADSQRPVRLDCRSAGTLLRLLVATCAVIPGQWILDGSPRLRDRPAAVRKAVATQQMVGARNEDFDVIGLADDALEAAVQVFFVRRGRVMGRRGFMIDKAEDLGRAELVSRALERLYFDYSDDNPLGWPKLVLVPAEPADTGLYRAWLSESRGSRVQIRVPQRGSKRALQATVTRNAEESFARHRLKRSTDHNSRARALNELQQELGLAASPLRIECYDMSHLSGQDYVGSMVVLEDGLPKKADYRRFKVRSVPGNDDFAAMHEVLTRRLTGYLEQRSRPVADRDGRFSYPPQLLLVDGGKGQLGVAVRVLQELGLDDEIPAAALAKQFEEVFVPGRAEPVRIPRQSEALYMLQRVRDESHRFAVEYHRTLRGRRMTRSALDGIAGLGPVRKARLTKELGGVRAVQRADLHELKALPWLPEAVAENVHAALHGKR